MMKRLEKQEEREKKEFGVVVVGVVGAARRISWGVPT
jgi:hypothetical protein